MSSARMTPVIPITDPPSEPEMRQRVRPREHLRRGNAGTILIVALQMRVWNTPLGRVTRLGTGLRQISFGWIPYLPISSGLVKPQAWRR
jgi:hypothetical protein